MKVYKHGVFWVSLSMLMGFLIYGCNMLEIVGSTRYIKRLFDAPKDI